MKGGKEKWMNYQITSSFQADRADCRHTALHWGREEPAKRDEEGDRNQPESFLVEQSTEQLTPLLGWCHWDAAAHPAQDQDRTQPSMDKYW